MSCSKSVARLALVAFVAMPIALHSEGENPGAAVYTKQCKSCHGADGTGNAKVAETMKMTIPDLTAAHDDRDATVAAWTKEIAEGEGKMPGYAKKLSADELKAVTDYTVKTFLAAQATK